MIKYSDFAGIIFDIDDTLLDNLPRDPVRRLHERSRLAAFHQVGKARNIPELLAVTPQQNLDAWLNAEVHSLEGAVWTVLFEQGLVADENIQHDNQLLLEVVALKDKLHEKILLEEGEEVPGASAFVRTLAANGFEGKMAIASTAVRRDALLFLDKVDLRRLFPDERIITKEGVTHLKPHPELFDTAFKTLGLPQSDKSRILVFEDDPRGVMAAKAAGMFVCVITTGYDREAFAKSTVPPDMIADSYAEFADKLGLPVPDKLVV